MHWVTKCTAEFVIFLSEIVLRYALMELMCVLTIMLRTYPLKSPITRYSVLKFDCLNYEAEATLLIHFHPA